MDYEKKYKEALERMKSWARGEHPECFTEAQKAAEFVFPELRESEDERISREITEFILTHRIDEPNDIEDTNLWLAWLEKQGEQRSKLVDFDYNAKDSDLQEVTYFIPNGFHAEIDGNKVVIKQGEQKSAVNFRAEDWCVSKVDGKIHNIYNSEVGPKFKVGDWITNGEYTWFIEGMHNRFYDIISPEGCGTDDTIIHVDGHFHLWTIGDAKDGDVLASKNGDNILIFRNLDTNTSFSSYYNIAGIGELGWSNNRFIPATKEQRDQLEKAMTDAGYTFDFEKKELRKIEQKPDWSEEDEKIALSIEHVMNCASLLNIVPEKVDKIRTWIKSLKQRMGGEE